MLYKATVLNGKGAVGSFIKEFIFSGGILKRCRSDMLFLLSKRVTFNLAPLFNRNERGEYNEEGIKEA